MVVVGVVVVVLVVAVVLEVTVVASEAVVVRAFPLDILILFLIGRGGAPRGGARGGFGGRGGARKNYKPILMQLF